MTKKPTYEELEKRIQELEQVESVNKKTGETLQISKYYLNNIINNIGDPVFVKDDEFRFVLANDSLCKILGIERENIIGKTLGESLPDNQMKHFLKIDKLVLESGQDNLCEEILTGVDGNILTIVTKKTRYVDEQGSRFIVGTIRDITERKQAEEELIMEKEFTEFALNSQQDTFFVFEPATGKAIRWNKAFRDITGYTDEEIASLKAPNSYYSQENLKKAASTTESVMLNGMAKIELHLICKDGRIIPTEYNVSLMPDKNGEPKYMVSSGRNITERKQAEKNLRESEARQSKMVANIGDVIVIIDQDGINRYKSPNIEKLFGWKPEDVVGASTWDVIHPDDIKSTQKFLEKILREPDTGGKIECRYRCKDGSYKWIEFTGTNLLHDPDIKGLLGNYHNITERKKMEKSLRESEARFKALHNASSGGISIHDKGIILDCNEGLSKMTGYSVAELIGMDGLLLIAEKSKNAVMDNILSGCEKQYEATGLRKNGEEFSIRLEARNIPYKGGNVRAVEFRDISERKLAEEEKLNAQKVAGEQKKLALVGQVAGKMAHDFNNILGIVMGNTELALLDCQEPKTKKTLELIYEQTIRGKNLTKNLVAFAKDQEPKQEFFRISEKIELVLNLMRKDLKEIELIKEDKPGVPELLADPGMIEHALINLMQNSIHATSMNESPRIIVRTYSFDNKICFEIEDNGCGISKENLENIYEPSFTLKGSKDVTGSYKAGIKGTGYGMANVKKYVEQHKGSISIESEVGVGATFTISLPVIKRELTKEEKSEIRTGITHFENYILLVEDETAIADVQYRILTQAPCNHKVDIANNGQFAMDLFERNKYDLISLDYILPGDINGMDIYN
jgi:PAS domain S-box-containing protein